MSYGRLSSENEYASLRFAVAPGRKRVPYYSYRAHREPNLLLALEIEACLMTALFSHICTGTGLAPAFSASGPGSPLPHLQCDWARRSRICNETGAHPGHIWARRSRICNDTEAHPGHICTRTGGKAQATLGIAVSSAQRSRPRARADRKGEAHRTARLARARERGADPSHALHLRIRCSRTETRWPNERLRARQQRASRRTRGCVRA